MAVKMVDKLGDELRDKAAEVKEAIKDAAKDGKIAAAREAMEEVAAGARMTEVKEAIKEAAKDLKSKKPLAEIAGEVIRGDWGKGEERRKKLSEAGYDFEAVQKEVNRILGK